MSSQYRLVSPSIVPGFYDFILTKYIKGTRESLLFHGH